MPYTPTGPFVNGSSPGISAAFLNAVEACLVNAISDTKITNDGNGNLTFTTGNLKRAAGNTEATKYFLQGGTNASGWTISQYMQSTSRGVTPASVTVDTADQSPAVGGASPITNSLSAYGVQIYFVATAASNTARVGGNLTFNY